ncbi:heat shock protein 23-like [Hyalella azteca]|uniref:Heat shock protein 23-like n=1 Tax=Hyalella azteca TaxID=294128 RepID=A0A8B7PF55_HYAAZ|nr:heat shock protein 23-like [Hyalella azteca]
MLPRVNRSVVPALRSAIRHRLLRSAPYAAANNGQVRSISGPPFRRDDPFVQMEAFMRDMDRKLRRTIDSAFGSFGQLPEWREGLLPRAAVSRTAQVGEALDVSSSDTFKLVFNCYQVKPEDIKVTLKDNLLTVSMKACSESEGRSVTQHTEHQQTLPPGVDASKLESSLSADGQLSVYAPREPPEGPQLIKVQRE